MEPGSRRSYPESLVRRNERYARDAQMSLRTLLSGGRSPTAAGNSPESSPLRPSVPAYKTVTRSAPGAARSPVVIAWQTVRGWFSRRAVTDFASLKQVRATRPITLDRAGERLRAGQSLAHYAVQGQVEANGPALEGLHALSRAGADLKDLTVRGPLRTAEQVASLAQWQPAERGLRLRGLRVEIALSTAATALGEDLQALHAAGADLREVKLSGPFPLSRTGTLPKWIASLGQAGADLSGLEPQGSFSCRQQEVLARVLAACAGMTQQQMRGVACNGALTSPDEESLALIGRALAAGVRMNELIIVGFPDGPEHAALRGGLAAAGVRLK